MWQCHDVIAYNSNPVFVVSIQSGTQVIVPNTVIWQVQGLDRRSRRWVDVGSAVKAEEIPADGVITITLSREQTKFVNGLSDQRRLVVNFYFDESKFQADFVEFRLTELPIIQPSDADPSEFADFKVDPAVLEELSLKGYNRDGSSFVEVNSKLQSVYIKANHPITFSGIRVYADEGGVTSDDFVVASFWEDDSYAVRILFPAVNSFTGQASITSQVTQETAVISFGQGGGSSAEVGVALVGSALVGVS